MIFKIEDARHRRASFWLVRLHLIAVLQHARAWVDSNAARRLVNHLLGHEAAEETAYPRPPCNPNSTVRPDPRKRGSASAVRAGCSIQR